MLSNPLQHNFPFPDVYSLTLDVISRSHRPLILAFAWLSHNRCVAISWINGCGFSTLDTFKRVIAIHGDEHVKDKLGFAHKLMRATRTGVTEPPSWVIALEGRIDALINTVANREVDVEAVRELLPKIRTEGSAVEVTECLDE